MTIAAMSIMSDIRISAIRSMSFRPAVLVIQRQRRVRGPAIGALLTATLMGVAAVAGMVANGIRAVMLAMLCLPHQRRPIVRIPAIGHPSIAIPTGGAAAGGMAAGGFPAATLAIAISFRQSK